MPVRHHVPQALKEIRGNLHPGLRKPHPLLAPVYTEQRIRLRLEKIGQVLRENHCDPRQVPQGRHHLPRLKLGKETGRQPGMPAQLNQPHRLLQPAAA